MSVPSGLSHRYARAVAQETIQELRLVKSISHRGEAGRAREGVLRRFLSRLCPPGVGLDSGFVVDGNGSSSGQIDLVIYRNDYYPIFEIGGVKHFPVESVIAVFEIKATADSTQKLREAMGQIEGVKALDRTGGGFNYILVPGLPKVNQNIFQCQVFGAVLAEKLVAAETAVDTLTDYCRGKERRLWPNLIVAAEDYSVRYIAANQQVSEDPGQAIGVTASAGGLDSPPLSDVAVALANALRVSEKIDYNPSNYFPSSTSHVVQRRLDDSDFPAAVSKYR